MPGTAKNTWARPLLLGARAALSLGLLALLAYSLDWRSITSALAEASPALVMASGLLYYLGIGLSCWKWQLLLRLERVEAGAGRLVRWYLIGAFASNFLPTDIGGDLGRGYLAGRATGQPLAVARSIIVERLSGLLFMLLLAWVGALVLLPWRGLTLGLGAAGLVGVGALWAGRGRAPSRGRPMAWGAALWSRLPVKLREIAASTGEVAVRARRRPTTLALLLLLSLIVQLHAGFGLWLNLYAVGARLPLAPVVLVMALASLIGLLPVSLNGWGVREAVLVALLAPLGADPARVVASSLLARAVILVLSAGGAALIPLEGAWRGGKRPAETPDGLK